MSFQTDVTREAEAVFTAMLTIQTSVIYKSITLGVYNPTTGVNDGEIIVTYAVTGMLRNYNAEDIRNSEIETKDVEIRILQSALSAITPKVNDRIVISGNDYDIINLKKDTAETRWTFQLRKK